MQTEGRVPQSPEGGTLGARTAVLVAASGPSQCAPPWGTGAPRGAFLKGLPPLPLLITKAQSPRVREAWGRVAG